MWPHRRQPTRLPHPWDSPSKNTGVGCHFLLQCMKIKSESEVVQSCPTLCHPMDCSLLGSSVHGIFQARGLEWGTIAFSSYRRPMGKEELGWWWPLSWRFQVLMKPQMGGGGRGREREAHPLGLSLEVRTSFDETTLEAVRFQFTSWVRHEVYWMLLQYLKWQNSSSLFI